MGRDGGKNLIDNEPKAEDCYSPAAGDGVEVDVTRF